MDEFAIRGAMVNSRIQRLMIEAIDPGIAPERLDAIYTEIKMLASKMHDLQEEQLISMLPKRRWWQRRKDKGSHEGS